MIKQREIHVEWTDAAVFDFEKEEIAKMAAEAERADSFTSWACSWRSSQVDVDGFGRAVRRPSGPVLAYLVEVTDDQETLS